MIEFQIELTDKPGQLAGVTEAIALGGANILGAAAIGKARPAVALVVDDEEATKKSLEEFGANYVMNELLLYTLEHRPGALAEFTRKIALAKADKIRKARRRGKDWYVQKHSKMAL